MDAQRLKCEKAETITARIAKVLDEYNLWNTLKRNITDTTNTNTWKTNTTNTNNWIQPTLGKLIQPTPTIGYNQHLEKE